MKTKLYLTILSLLISVAIFSACSSSKKTTTSDTGENIKDKTAKIVVPNYSATELEEGRMLWQGSCDRCHKLYSPESRSKEKWEKILPRMVKRSKLTDSQAGKVRGYIMSQAAS